MNGNPPVISTPPKRTGWIVYAVVVTGLLFLSLLGNLILFAIALGGAGPEAGIGPGSRRFEEQLVGGDTDTRNKIVVIYLHGVISSSEDHALSPEGLVGDIKDQLQQALDDRHVKAIILRINSPGGEVVASDSIYQAVVTARDQKPVVASIDTVGASGAYYVAVGSDYIMATDLSITASVGVILQSYAFGGYENSLMDKIGIRSYTFKSGRYKDVLNPTREPTEEEKELVQSLIMEVYDKFVGIVAEERELDVDELRNGMADGRILTGNQALEAGLVDGLGYFEDAIEKAKDLARVDKARVVRYMYPFSLRDLFSFLGKQDRTRVQLEITPRPFRLEAGKLYLLPAYLFQ